MIDRRRLLAASLAATCPALPLTVFDTMNATADQDPYLWLEDVTGERALAWVRERGGGVPQLAHSCERGLHRYCLRRDGRTPSHFLY